MKKAILPSLVAVFALAETTSGAEQIQTFASETQEIQAFASEAQEIQSYELEETLVEAHAHDTQKYSSGASLGKSQLDSTPSGNGDIGSALKVLPNVQYDNTQSRSTTPGEIDPANVSISGGLHYQNNFQIDGFNMNNDLTSNVARGHNINTGFGGTSQGLNIDTSLLESIVVQDSNIGAAYGGFTGGVVEANVRRARKDGKWHTDISYQMTQGNANGFSLTQYHTDERAKDALLNSTDENYQPKFIKHIVRASLEGYITDTFGIVASFNTTQSFIPLFASDNTGQNGQKWTQKRQSYNYYIKGHYQPNENFLLELNLGYLPQYNTYFEPGDFDSFYTYSVGGYQGGVKAISMHKLGTWTNSLGYSYLENSRQTDIPVYYRWYMSPENDYGLGNYSTRYDSRYIRQGNDGDLDQKAQSLPFKSDFAFEPVKAWLGTHTFHIGFELNYQWAKKVRPRDYPQYSYWGGVATSGTATNQTLTGQGLPRPLLPGQSCPIGPDRFGGYPCAYGKPYDKPNVWTQQDYDQAIGQWFDRIGSFFSKTSLSMSEFSYGAFVEDDIHFDLGKFGELNTRLGLRLDGDDYMSKKTLAPRFAINYITPAPQSYQTKLTFGANRYYARNLFSYRLLDFPPADSVKQYTRNGPDEDWVEDKVTSFNFSYGVLLDKKLNIPYDDELMAGLSQNFGIFNANLKYIYREGKDELNRVRNTSLNLGTLPAPNGSQYGYSVWRNEGSSKRHIVSLTVENYEPIKTLGIQHHYLLAFDYTDVKRSYSTTSYDTLDFSDADIIYDGKLIKYRDRPVDNYARPYTLRLSTTHTAKFWRTKWLFNNFFRYRSPYERMVTVSTSKTNAKFKEWSALYPNIEGVYEKKRFAGAFTWDMRVGFEVDVHKGNTFYTNVDIINVLNKANQTAISNSSGNVGDGIAGSAYTYSVYEVGRQFWLQVGYKY